MLTLERAEQASVMIVLPLKRQRGLSAPWERGRGKTLKLQILAYEVEQDGGNKWVKDHPASLIWFPWICSLFIQCTEGSSQPLYTQLNDYSNLCRADLGRRDTLDGESLMESFKTDNRQNRPWRTLQTLSKLPNHSIKL